MRPTALGALAVACALATVAAACGDDDSKATTTTAKAGTATTAAGGASSTAAAGGGTVDVKAFKPIKADTLTIVTSLPGPGFFDGSDSDPTKITGGFEYDLAKALQAKLGLKNLEIRNENFDAIVAGQAGSFDLALSQVTITDERKKVVDFTEPYWESDQGALAKAGTKLATVDDAKKLLWALQTGTTGADLVNDRIKPAKQPQVFQNLADAFTALNAGQVDAVMMDTSIILGEASRSGGKLAVTAQFKTGEQYGGIVPKNAPQANKDVLNGLIKGLKADGSLTAFAQKDLGGDPTKVPVVPLP
jgi:polar amino acid transport system substrate-binding protein